MQCFGTLHGGPTSHGIQNAHEPSMGRWVLFPRCFHRVFDQSAFGLVAFQHIRFWGHPGSHPKMVDAENEFFDHTEPVYLLSLGKQAAAFLLQSPQSLTRMSLDGGGVRGISEAVMLHEIMTRLQKELGLKKLPKPCDYFHLIGGTSTGGYDHVPHKPPWVRNLG